MKPEQSLIAGWSESIKGADAVILADEFECSHPGQTTVRVPVVDMNVYFRRWLHIWQHLRDHPEYQFVWCTDGTDVEMLREPWNEMNPGVIYVGSEPKTYSDEWAIKNHPERVYQSFLKQYASDTMLNAGLLGGLREDVMEFAHRIVRLYYRIESERFWKKEGAARAVGDMIAFGIVAKSFGDRVITGPKVHTVFKTNGIGKETAWWQHK